ncbi:N-acetylmuramoyl-L-alanine amidase [Halobacillus sp. A1]|uniref:N-acetylmuramoyl-L-alanine amidase n=1 Tax=Halobacillus sp. A1 TaxID=2880262 RepID=UPI0020A6326E|nr:N-acetylmuramoyl-L-alanine amidase [Halobacillus sp. A1]MCP3032744.1 N-acetylmuramoyl-L-alanine amidase [Halobacillus sp. A1]
MKNTLIIIVGVLICLFIFQPTVDADSGQLYKVNVETLTLRDAPNQSATVLGYLKIGAKVTVFLQSDGWGSTYYNGKEAWVSLNMLEEKNGFPDAAVSGESGKGDPQLITEENEEEEPKAETIQQYKDEKLEELDEKEHTTAGITHKDKNLEGQRKQSGEKTLAGYHFIIDPGHGGKDPGAVRSELYEKTITLSTAKKVDELLRDKGASVTLTRTDDTFIPVEERVQLSNSTTADAFISLHYNTFKDQSISGIDTFYNNVDESQQLAVAIQRSLVNHVKFTNRGSKQASYQVLRENKHPALLIELGFISNPEERKLVRTDTYQEKAAKGIVSGLENYFNND